VEETATAEEDEVGRRDRSHSPGQVGPGGGGDTVERGGLLRIAREGMHRASGPEPAGDGEKRGQDHLVAEIAETVVAGDEKP